MPFLSVVTRCYKRPSMLQWNQASLEAQTDGDWEQVLLVDEVGRGVPWANRNLADERERARGEYVWILDDDDESIDMTLVATLKELARESDPDLVMVKMDHGVKIGVLPPDELWLKRPLYCHCGVSSIIAKNGLWQEAVQRFGAHHGGDIHYAQAAYDMAHKMYWLDRVVCRVQRVSWGRPDDGNGDLAELQARTEYGAHCGITAPADGSGGNLAHQ